MEKVDFYFLFERKRFNLTANIDCNASAFADLNFCIMPLKLGKDSCVLKHFEFHSYLTYLHYY